MKIVISYKNVKRKIEGPFNVCGSREDLYRLASLIVRDLYEGAAISEGKIVETGGHYYGWVYITDPEPKQECLKNTEPIGWED